MCNQDSEVMNISPNEPRAGWEEVFREMAKRGDDRLLDAPLPTLTRFDKDEWEW